MATEYPIKIKAWDQTNGYTFDITKSDGTIETHKFIGFEPGNLTSFYTQLLGITNVAPGAVSGAVSGPDGTGAVPGAVSGDGDGTGVAPGAVSGDGDVTVSNIEYILDELIPQNDKTFNVVTKNNSTFSITIKKLDNDNFNYTGLDGTTVRKTKNDLTQYLTRFKEINK